MHEGAYMYNLSEIVFFSGELALPWYGSQIKFSFTFNLYFPLVYALNPVPLMASNK